MTTNKALETANRNQRASIAQLQAAVQAKDAEIGELNRRDGERLEILIDYWRPSKISVCRRRRLEEEDTGN
jgi:hypothetical protein